MRLELKQCIAVRLVRKRGKALQARLGANRRARGRLRARRARVAPAAPLRSRRDRSTRPNRFVLVGARISDPRHTRNHMMEKFMTDSWDALRFDRAEWSGGHAVMAADPKPFRSNPPERHTLQRKLFSTSFSSFSDIPPRTLSFSPFGMQVPAGFTAADGPAVSDAPPLSFDVRTRNGRDQLQCLIVFYDQQDPHLLKVSDHYSSRHDLVLVFH